MDEELAVQMPIVKEVLDALGIVRCELAGYEADDLLGTISRRANENGDECVILTGDRDSLQLVGGGTVVRLVKSALGKTTYTSYTPEKFREEYGFDPIRLIDFKALMGDSSDNIPGVKGVGEKGARQLLADFGTLDGIYEHIDDERIKKGVRTKLQADEQGARDSYWLATIDRNVPLELDVAHLPEQKIDREALYSLLTRLEFDQFIRKLGLTEGGEAAELHHRIGVRGVRSHRLADRGGPRFCPCRENARRALPAFRRHGVFPVCGRHGGRMERCDRASV